MKNPVDLVRFDFNHQVNNSWLNAFSWRNVMEPEENFCFSFGVATLFSLRAVENAAVVALNNCGISVFKYNLISDLVANLNSSDIDAIVIEDSSSHQLLDWLAMIKMHCIKDIPVIVIGAGGSENIARALQHGAAEYSVMSEGVGTLIQRVEAQILLRHQVGGAPTLIIDEYVIDAKSLKIKMRDFSVQLTLKEFSLACVFFENFGRVISLGSLSAKVWGRSNDFGQRTIEQHIYRLRKKFKEIDRQNNFQSQLKIQAIYGVGYRLDVFYASHHGVSSASGIAVTSTD